jgi:sodium-dependent dicarboxylate transporter 2/3/5
MAILLFIIPSSPNFMALFRSSSSGEEEPITTSPALINWNLIEKKMPWGVILLFGGGFALAAGSDSSGVNFINIYSQLFCTKVFCAAFF